MHVQAHAQTHDMHSRMCPYMGIGAHMYMYMHMHMYMYMYMYMHMHMHICACAWWAPRRINQTAREGRNKRHTHRKAGIRPFKVNEEIGLDDRSRGGKTGT